MNGSYAVQMGDRGRFVVPKELRDRIGLSEGTPLLLLESEEGMVVMTRAQALRRLRGQLVGASLVEELLEDRRRAAAEEDR